MMADFGRISEIRDGNVDWQVGRSCLGYPCRVMVERHEDKRSMGRLQKETEMLEMEKSSDEEGCRMRFFGEDAWCPMSRKRKEEKGIRRR